MAQGSSSQSWQINKTVDKASDMIKDAAGQTKGMVDRTTAQAGEAAEGVQEWQAI
jgi:hypothetical protein